MKRFLMISVVAIAATLTGCNMAGAKSGNKVATMEFAALVHNFDTIAQNSEAVYAFVFENTGKEPLIISNVQTTCGCTVPDWTRDPVAKGKKGTIKISYNTSRTGSFEKSVSVYSNASNSPVSLKVKGTVIPVSEKQEKTLEK